MNFKPAAAFSSSSSSSLLSLSLSFLLVAASSIACGSVVGTGKDGTPIPGVDPNAPGGTTSPPSSATPGGQTQEPGTSDGTTAAPTTTSGAPAEIEALFQPPTTNQVTPNSIFGLWAATDSTSEERIKLTTTDLTLARKCKSDGHIAYVTVKVRGDADEITILETKEGVLDYSKNNSCLFKVSLEVGQWTSCNAPGTHDYSSCFTISGTKLMGLDLADSGVFVDDWLKLAD